MYDKLLEREIFENTIRVMKAYGPEPVLSFLSNKFLKKKEIVKSSMLSYYESTEEFEKCLEITRFFNRLELLIKEKEKQKD
jgi:hypothetical protein